METSSQKFYMQLLQVIRIGINFGIQIYNNLQNKNNKIKFKCKKIIPISTSDFNQLATRPKYSVLSNKKLEKFLNVKLKNWREEHENLY